ncbi:glycosyltransferase [Microbacterium gorillae]|uniref:glycosyltransferase n=1 Tax=Microbacterium gorillae TaxID=1231063 RepID=UPI003D95CEFE
MRVLFDGYWWDGDARGTRAVQREIILAWHRSFPGDELSVALRPDSSAVDLPAGVSRVAVRLRPHALSNLVELGRLARRVRAEALVVHDFTPLGGSTATIVHDAMHRDHPAWFPMSQRIYSSAILPSARFAAIVATGTRSEAARIERHEWVLAPVTSIGVAARTSLTTASPIRPAIVADVSDFAVTRGRLGTRDGIDDAVSAALASSRVTPESPLIVVVDSSRRSVEARLSARHRAARDTGRVRFSGRLTPAELSWMLRHTAVALTLAPDENMALPAMEATWFDAPLVASDVPAHREVVGGWAQLVPVGDAAAAAAAIDAQWHAAGDEEARERILARANWRAAARELRAAIVSSATR